MKMMSLNVKVEELEKLSAMFSKGMAESAFPNTAQAFRQSRGLARQRWADYVAGEGTLDGLDPAEKPSAKLAQSVKSERKKAFDYSVYSESPQMMKIVEGEPSVDYDMKRTHPYGRKSRVSKKGVPYLIVNFRWGTPNAKGEARARWNSFIPQKIYETSMFKKILRKRSETIGLTHPELNAELNAVGKMIVRAKYIWGGRLTEADSWNDRSAGMVRMKDSANGKSTYFTFRVISAKSPQGSWLYHKDAKPPVDILGALKKTVEGDIRKMIQDGMKSDADMYMNGE